MIYSPLCLIKTKLLSLFCGTQKGVLMNVHATFFRCWKWLGTGTVEFKNAQKQHETCLFNLCATFQDF